MNVLVTGATGLIGNNLFQYLKKKGENVIGTYLPGESRPYLRNYLALDLRQADFSGLESLKGLTHVIFCHGINGIEECRNKFSLSNRVNVDNTIRLMKVLKKRYPTLIPVYLSTSMVYSAAQRNPEETANIKPYTLYAVQKLKVEDYIKKNFGSYIILRLAKVFGVDKRNKSIFTAWAEQFRKGQAIDAISDMVIAPVYVEDVSRMLYRLCKGQHYGVYNLAGDKKASFYSFAVALASVFKHPRVQINKKFVKDFNFSEPRARFNAPNSAKILRVTKIKPTPVEKCFSLIKKTYN